MRTTPFRNDIRRRGNISLHPSLALFLLLMTASCCCSALLLASRRTSTTGMMVRSGSLPRTVVGGGISVSSSSSSRRRGVHYHYYCYGRKIFSTASTDTAPSNHHNHHNRSIGTESLSAKKTTAETCPWTRPQLAEVVAQKRRNNNARFRQHVNPLASQFQTPTQLPDQWPHSAFDDCRRPLHLDIGCGKGGFLLDLCRTEIDGQAELQQPILRSENEDPNENKDHSNSNSNNSNPNDWNYLGLEIRPGVAKFAQDRVAAHGYTGRLQFLGCNVNVDLERLLTLYANAATSANAELQHPILPPLHRVTIQFPDPHFKARNAKRRVVNAALIEALARFMPPKAPVILQSDVQFVLDEMRARFREFDAYFTDTLDDTNAYLPENVLGVPTERERSVLQQNLPVYRALLTRKTMTNE